MSKIIACSTFPCGKSLLILASKNPTFLIPVRGKRIPSYKRLLAGDGDYSQTDPGKLTDIRHYQLLDKSHLHKWEGKSSKRKFELKLEELKKKQFFTKDTSSTSTQLDKTTDPEKVESVDSMNDNSKKIDSIIIPTYIDRSPSTILRALASCVGRDNTAPDYKYHDDPFLIPYNSIQKREFILAKDSGRKAARYVLDNHPELFTDNLIYDEPKVSKYLPKVDAKGKERNASFLKELLMQNISSFHVLGAIETYELLEKIPTGIEKIDNNTMIELLELLCYYNNEEETDLEAHQLLAGMFPEEKEKTWMVDGLAQRLYSEMIDSPRFENDIKDRARLAILCGKAKCRGSDKNASNTDNVSQILEECKASNTNLNIEAYNAVLSGLATKQKNFEIGKGKLMEILEEMSENKIHPNEQTLLNSIKYIFHLVAKSRDTTNHYATDAERTVLSLLSEFRSLGVEPSLASYEYIIKLYNLSALREKCHSIIFDIIEELENKQKSGSSLKVIIPEDVNFFYQAMQWINRLSNVKLAYRTHRLLLNEGENYNALLGGFMNQTYYYKHLLLIAIHNDSLDVAMELYSALVPHTFSPTLDIYRRILDEIKTQVGYKHVPRLWTDLTASQFAGSGIKGQMPIIESFVGTMAEADLEVFVDSNDAENQEKRNLLKSFTLIGREVFNEIQFVSEKLSKQLPLSGNQHAIPIFNKIMETAIKQINEDEVADFSLVVDVMNFSQDQQTSLMGSIDPELLMQIVRAVIKLPLTGGKKLGLECVTYAAENRYESALTMANMITKHFSNLEKIEKSQLNQLFAHETEWTNID